MFIDISYLNYIILFIMMIFISELLAYCWHKFGAHEDIIPEMFKVQESHLKHHTIVDDSAYDDFMYILIFLIVYTFLLIYLIKIQMITYLLASCIYFPVLMASFWNFYIHSAYHSENHWLNEYEWFRNDKRIHFQHHRNPTTNYGISTHFSDVIFDTFDYGLLKDI